MFFIFFSFFICILLLFFGLCVILSKNPIHSIFFLVLEFFCASALLLLNDVEFLGMIFLIIYVGAIAVLFLFVIMMLNIRVLELSEDLFKYLPVLLVFGFFFLYQGFKLYSKSSDNILYPLLGLDTLYGLSFGDFIPGKSETAEDLIKNYGSSFVYESSSYAPTVNHSFMGGSTTKAFDGDLTNSIFAVSSLKTIAEMLFIHYVSLFWLAGFILLVSMIGAIFLTLNQDSVKNNSSILLKRQLIYKQMSRDHYKTVKVL